MKPNFAIVATGGKQYMAETGSHIKVEKINGEPGQTLDLSEVLLAGEGEQVVVGKPFISGAVVAAEIVKQGRAKKVVGVKFKPKKREKVSFGHRQPFTELKINEIKLV